MPTQDLTIRLGVSGYGDVKRSMESVSSAASGVAGAVRGIIAPLVAVAGSALALRGIAAGLRGVIDAGGKLTDLSSSTGVAMDRLVRFQQVFTDAGRSADTVGQTFARVSTSILAAAENGGDAARAIATLGLNADELIRMSPDRQFELIGRKIGDIENPTIRAATAMRIFGRSGTELLPVFEQLSNAEATEAALGRLPELMARNAQVLDSISDNFGRMQIKGRQLFIGILDQIAPEIEAFTDRIMRVDYTALGQDIGAFLKVLYDSWEQGRFAEVVGLSLEAGFEMGGQAMRRFMDDFAASMAKPGLWQGVLEVVNSIGKVLTNIILGLSVPFMALGDLVVTVLGNAFQGAVNVLIRGLNAAIEGFNRLFGASVGRIGEMSAVGEIDFGASLDRALAAYKDGSQYADRFFTRSTDAGRSLLGGGDGPGGGSAGQQVSATERLKALLNDVREAREASVKAEKEIGVLMGEHVDPAAIIRNMRREELEAQLRLRVLAQEIARIQGDFAITQAQKWSLQRKVLTEQRQELERIIRLLRERAQLPGLTDQDREQMLSRADRAEGQLAGVNTRFETMGPDPNSMREQMLSTMTDMQDQFGTTAEAVARSFRDVIGTAVDSVSAGLQTLIGNTRYWTAQLGTVAGPIMGALTGAISRMFTEWMAKRALVALKDIMWSKKEAAAKAPGALLTSITSYGAAAVIGLAAVLGAMAAFGGFQKGGYTGDVPKNAVAGVVHGQEFVFDAASVERIGVPNLEALRAGEAIGTPLAGTPAQPEGRTEVNIAAFDNRVDVRRWADSVEGEAWFVDMAKKTAHRIRS